MEVIKTREIGKIYKGYKGFLRKRKLEALKEIDIKIKEGEVRPYFFPPISWPRQKRSVIG